MQYKNFLKQKRYRGMNAEAHVLHFAQLKALFEKYKFDSQRVWNLD